MTLKEEIDSLLKDVKLAQDLSLNVRGERNDAWEQPSLRISPQALTALLNVYNLKSYKKDI